MKLKLWSLSYEAKAKAKNILCGEKKDKLTEIFSDGQSILKKISLCLNLFHCKHTHYRCVDGSIKLEARLCECQSQRILWIQSTQPSAQVGGTSSKESKRYSVAGPCCRCCDSVRKGCSLKIMLSLQINSMYI